MGIYSGHGGVLHASVLDVGCGGVVMSHSKAIKDYANVEAHAQMHDELVALQAQLSRAQRWCKVYGRARTLIVLGKGANEALAELDAYEQELFPEDREREQHEAPEPMEQWARND